MEEKNYKILYTRVNSNEHFHATKLKELLVNKVKIERTRKEGMRIGEEEKK